MTDGHLLDVNVLVALVWPQHVHHARVQEWFTAQDTAWWTTPLTESGLVRLSLNRAVSGTDISAVAALELMAALRAHPRHRFVADDTSLTDARVALTRFATGRQVTDLHLVNLCAVHQLVLATLDHGIPDMLESGDREHVTLIPGH